MFVKKILGLSDGGAFLSEIFRSKPEKNGSRKATIVHLNMESGFDEKLKETLLMCNGGDHVLKYSGSNDDWREYDSKINTIQSVLNEFMTKYKAAIQYHTLHLKRSVTMNPDWYNTKDIFEDGSNYYSMKLDISECINVYDKKSSLQIRSRMIMFPELF